jgi:hypothetical protein
MTTLNKLDSFEVIAEQERQAWIAGDTVKATMLARLADAVETTEGEDDRLGESYADGEKTGRADGICTVREAIQPVMDELEELAYGKGAIKKAEFVAVFERLTKALDDAE